MKNFKITVTDTATYIIAAEDEDMATGLAVEWFSEREPDINVTVTDDEPEYTIK